MSVSTKSRHGGGYGALPSAVVMDAVIAYREKVILYAWEYENTDNLLAGLPASWAPINTT